MSAKEKQRAARCTGCRTANGQNAVAAQEGVSHKRILDYLVVDDAAAVRPVPQRGERGDKQRERSAPRDGIRCGGKRWLKDARALGRLGAWTEACGRLEIPLMSRWRRYMLSEYSTALLSSVSLTSFAPPLS